MGTRESNGQPIEHLPSSAPDAAREPAPEFPSEEERGNLPVHVVRFGAVRASIWEVQTDAGPRHNITVCRRYQGRDGLWYASAVFSLRDLLPLAKALDWAHTWISERIAAASDVPF